MSDDKVRLVYRPKSEFEARRRANRAKDLVGTPFIHLPGKPPQHKVLFESDGHKVRVEHVEMVFNDALLMDAVSNWGEDGPLYADTLADDPPVQREAYAYALKAYEGVEIPEKLKNPRAS